MSQEAAPVFTPEICAWKYNIRAQVGTPNFENLNDKECLENGGADLTEDQIRMGSAHRKRPIRGPPAVTMCCR